jgi:3-isopropylmalate/(R)-2-methylmalate dehydratase small subunit
VSAPGAAGVRRGRVHLFGPNINTDDIIAGKYKHRTIDLDELCPHLMENIRPGFVDQVSPGDFVVAGPNFGCGSSREQAPALLRHIGLTGVVAPSFARIFFRNAVNIGLRLIEVPTDGLAEGDELQFDESRRLLRVLGRDWSAETPPTPPELAELIAAGGLLPYVRAGGLR